MLTTKTTVADESFPAEISAESYLVRIAQTPKEIESALRLRFEVFNLELAAEESKSKDTAGIEFDEYDFNCRHLIVIEKRTQKTVGTYRINSIETAGTTSGFYSYGEFSIEDLPTEMLTEAIEIGRACIAREHRNTRVLFLLWKGLANYIKHSKKRYLFGCCSIFTTDPSIGSQAFHQLKQDNFLHQRHRVNPRRGKQCQMKNDAEEKIPVELPSLFKMYLKIGAKICGAPVIDREFGTIDFFVVFDVKSMNEKYRRMFFGRDFQTNTLSSRSNLKSLSTLKTVEQRVP